MLDDPTQTNQVRASGEHGEEVLWSEGVKDSLAFAPKHFQYNLIFDTMKLVISSAPILDPSGAGLWPRLQGFIRNASDLQG